MKVIRRFWDDTLGWGDVLVETEHYIMVRFDSDPSTYYQIVKK